MADPLNNLLAAPSREALDKFFAACFRFRSCHAEAVACRAVVELGFEPEVASATVAAGIALVAKVLYESSDIQSAEAVLPFIPAGVDNRLTTLISELLFASLPRWRDAAIDQRVSLPRLEKLDWRVDVVSAASSALVLSTPKLIMECAIRDQPALEGVLPAVRHVHVEMDHAALGALLDGMRRIKGKLDAALPT